MRRWRAAALASLPVDDEGRPTAPTDATTVDPFSDEDPDIFSPAAEPSGPTVEEDPPAKAGGSGRSTTRNLLEWVAVVVGAVLVALVFRTFLFQTFWIPSESMEQTLVDGDRVVVNKLSYRFGDVSRGDVVVFRRPENASESLIKDLIKRVVATGGEQVTLVDGRVHIDGRLLEEPYIRGAPTTPCGMDALGLGHPEGLQVPEGHVLVMGDNREHSHDGRCFGPIDEDLIVGRAFVIIWPFSNITGL